MFRFLQLHIRFTIFFFYICLGNVNKKTPKKISKRSCSLSFKMEETHTLESQKHVGEVSKQHDDEEQLSDEEVLDFSELIEQNHLELVTNLDLERQFMFR